MTGQRFKHHHSNSGCAATCADDYEMCPEHGDSLGYHPDQGDEYEPREHLECTERGCDYEVWAS